MPAYYPVQCLRSDGQQETPGRDGTMEPNQPTADQLSQRVQKDKDGAFKDYYRKVERGSEKDIDWRRKLGGMLMHLAGTPEQLKKNWILQDVPEDYTLWEHVKYAVDQNGQAKKSGSTHAAGGMDRQDAYLYGHPQGRKKRFRSPTEFFEHFLWLVADDPINPIPCHCKICLPILSEEVEKASAQTDEKANDSGAKAINAASILKQTSTPTASPAPAPRSREQIRDRDSNSPWLYRLGELVWFSKGQAWGLAIIAKRQENPPGTPRYLLQPLSHPLHHGKPLIKNSEDELRPWLAWSVPSTTHLSINDLIFDTVPWKRVLDGEFGAGDSEVDGSILAAKAIDTSYSFFARIDSTPHEQHWNAMFLGAEKIWVGEPVRLRGPATGSEDADIYIMIVHQMIEKTNDTAGIANPSQNPNSNPAPSSEVTLIGDIYRFTITNKSTDPPPHLPIRVLADLRFRNNAARSGNAIKRSEYYTWTLTEARASRSIFDIKGRWYESRKLLCTLRGPALFQADLAQGVTSDVGTWMNGRGDSTEIPTSGGTRRKNRRATLGASVPETFTISRGLDSIDSRGVQFDDCGFAEDDGNGQGQGQIMDGGDSRIGGLMDQGDDVGDLNQFFHLEAAETGGYYGDTMEH